MTIRASGGSQVTRRSVLLGVLATAAAAASRPAHADQPPPSFRGDEREVEDDQIGFRAIAINCA